MVLPLCQNKYLRPKDKFKNAKKSFRGRDIYENLIVVNLFIELPVSYRILSFIAVNTKVCP
jgi:ribosomal protein S6E (S10)